MQVLCRLAGRPPDASVVAPLSFELNMRWLKATQAPSTSPSPCLWIKGPLSNGFDAMTTKRWTYPGALDAPSL